MRNGSSGHEGRGRQPVQHPYQPGPQPGPEQGVPYGPEISWPAGFRQMEFDSGEYRQLVESSYAGDRHERVDPRYGRAPGQPSRGYEQPATDDFGYGDPGYADPAYDGPREQGRYAAGPAPYAVPGYGVPGRPAPGYPGGSVAGSDHIYPVTGAQEVYREPDEPSAQPPSAYAEPDYEQPREYDPRLAGLRYDELRYDEREFAGQRHDDPRHEGPRYDEPRYDEPRYDEPRYDEPRYDEPRYDDQPRYDEPMDDETWYRELRRSGPAFPQRPADPGGAPSPGGRGGSGFSGTGVPAAGPGRFAGPAAPSGPVSQGPVSQPQAVMRAPVKGPGPVMGSAPDPGAAYQAASPYLPGVQGRPGAPGLLAPQGSGPQGSGPFGSGPLGSGPRPRVALPPVHAGSPDLAASGYLSAPAAQVGVLTPPGGSRLEPPQTQAHSGTMVGPDTVAWDVATEAEELYSVADYAQGDGGYSALLEELGSGPGSPDGTLAEPTVAKRQVGRRRGRSNDHRLWIGLGGVVVVAAAAITGIIKFEFPSHSGPVHTLITPAKVASYVRNQNLERQSGLATLRAKVINMSSGQATGVVSAEYESGGSTPGSAAQIAMFIGGHLPNSSPASSIATFTQTYKNAQVVSAGPLGGEAACVQEANGTSDSVAMCAWFDDDSFGVVVSPTMNANALAGVMNTFRPSVELVVKK